MRPMQHAQSDMRACMQGNAMQCGPSRSRQLAAVLCMQAGVHTCMPYPGCIDDAAELDGQATFPLLRHAVAQRSVALSLSPLLLLEQAPRCAAAPGVCVNCWAAVLLLSTKSPR